MSSADDLPEDEPAAEADEFKPVGTVAFLAIYAVVLMALWVSMYLTMLDRGGTG